MSRSRAVRPMPSRQIDPQMIQDRHLARFLSRITVDESTGCHLWVAGRFANGYGAFSIGTGKSRRLCKAHRVAWVIATGLDIPAGLTIDHVCRNRACVNIGHLRTLTQRDNVTAPGSLTGANFRKERRTA